MSTKTKTATSTPRARPTLRRVLLPFALVTLLAAPAAAEPPPAAPAAPQGTSAPSVATAPQGGPLPSSQDPSLNTFPPAGPPIQPAPPPVAPLGPPVQPFRPIAPLPDAQLPSEAIAQFKQKKRAIIAGAIVFGLAYYGALAASSAGISVDGSDSREYIAGLVPIVGPFITAGLRAAPAPPNAFNPQPGQPDYAGMGLYLALGVAQSVGAGVLVAGLRMPTGRAPRPCAERLDARRPCPPAPLPVRVSFQPIVSPTFAGGGLTGVF